MAPTNPCGRDRDPLPDLQPGHLTLDGDAPGLLFGELPAAPATMSDEAFDAVFHKARQAFLLAVGPVLAVAKADHGAQAVAPIVTGAVAACAQLAFNGRSPGADEAKVLGALQHALAECVRQLFEAERAGTQHAGACE